MNRRSFFKKIRNLGFFCFVPALPFFKKSKPKVVDPEYNWDATPRINPKTLGLDKTKERFVWKTHSASVTMLIDDSTPPGYVDFVNLKMLNFQKSMNKEMARSLYGP